MIVSLIVAMAENCVIGREGELPWRLPSDLRRFRERTAGHPVIMGRNTHESIGRALPGRTNIVLAGDGYTPKDGALRARSFSEAFKVARDADGGEEIFIIGGESVYRQAIDLDLADRLYMTLVHAAINGDAVFPEIDFNAWREVRRESGTRSPEDEYDFTFFTYERSRD